MGSSVFAQQDNLNFKGFSPDPSLGFKIKSIWFDIVENIAFTQEKKVEFKLANAQALQDEIDYLDKNNYVIPAEIEQKRLQKLSEVKEIVDTHSQMSDEKIEIFSKLHGLAKDTVGNVIEKLEDVKDLNEIRILYGQFPNVLKADDATKKEFNDKVNSLKSWSENCIGTFDVTDYALTNESYDKLADKCPTLKKYSSEKAKLLITGNV